MTARLFEMDIVAEECEEGQALDELRHAVRGDPEGRVWFVTPGPNGWPTAFVRVSSPEALGRLEVWMDRTGQSLPDSELPIETPLPFNRRAR